MKKFITILISCSLGLAASAIAQQDEEQQKPKKEQPEKTHPAKEAKPSPKPHSVTKEHPETRARGQEKGATESTETTSKPHTETKVHGKQGNATAEENMQGNKERGARNEAATTNNPPTPTPAGAEANTENPPGNEKNRRGNGLNAQEKKPDIQAIKAQHASFRAQPRPDKVPAVTFNQNYHIGGSEKWQGAQYAAFRSYHPQWHDQGWYRSHYQRVELIGGGYYYWNNDGYWYPAWGYDPSAQYYAYDGPVYVGSSAEPPDRVIADVQASLQEMGYYQGEVDGLLGPLTRQALAAYQADHGLYATEAIDEPTLASLGLA